MYNVFDLLKANAKATPQQERRKNLLLSISNTSVDNQSEDGFIKISPKMDGRIKMRPKCQLEGSQSAD